MSIDRFFLLVYYFVIRSEDPLTKRAKKFVNVTVHENGCISSSTLVVSSSEVNFIVSITRENHIHNIKASMT